MAHKFINHSLAYLSTIPSRIPSIYTKQRRKSNEHSDSRAKQSLARDTWMTNNTPLGRRGRGRGRRGRYNSWLVIIRSVKQRWNMIIVIRATPGLSYFLGRHYHNGVVACTRSGHVRPGREGPAPNPRDWCGLWALQRNSTSFIQAYCIVRCSSRDPYVNYIN